MKNKTVGQDKPVVDSLELSFGDASIHTDRSMRLAWLRDLLKKLIITLLLLGIGAWFYYQFALAPTPVLAHRIATGEVVSEVMGTGTLEARVKATVGAKIAGLITEVLVDQGDLVYAGQVLVRLDDRDLRRQVEVEEANVAAQKAALDRLTADKTYSQAAFNLATSKHERANQLIGTGAITEEELDIIESALSAARAGVDRAEAALVEGQKEIVAAQKQLEYQQALLDDTVVVAPFNGLIVRRDRDPGETIVPGTSVLQLISLEEVWVRAWVDETEIARLKADQPARVIFRSEPDHEYTGRVARLGRESDRETREFLVDVLPDKLPQTWAVGQRVDVFIETARTTGPILPGQFLATRAGEPGAFVLVDGKAMWRKLTPGLRGRQAMSITTGLNPGDLVVAPRGPKTAPLTDGRRVVVP